jgi:type I restriction enzyme M protein
VRASRRPNWHAFASGAGRAAIIEGRDFTEAKRRQAYAEQVANTFFVRLLLARILEDKRVVRRLISDGSLDSWRTIVQPVTPASWQPPAALHGRVLLDVLFQTMSQSYQHLFSQPVFDWFLPDAYFLAIALEKLPTSSFAGLNRDLLGFAYEAYVTRAFRNAKGNFLTDPAIVDYGVPAR